MAGLAFGGGVDRRDGEFFLGTFKVAAEAGVPIVPGTFRGTRTMLRGDQWSPLGVIIEEPIMPSATAFSSLLQLRDAARRVMLERCGEPDLGELVKPPCSA